MYFHIKEKGYMPLWGNDVEKTQKAVDELRDMLYELEENKDNNLAPELKTKTVQLVDKLEKTSEKTFDKIVHEVPLVGYYIGRAIGALVPYEKPTAIYRLAVLAAVMNFRKAQFFESRDILKTVGRELFFHKRFEVAYDMFKEAATIGATVAKMAAEAQDEQIFASWRNIIDDFTLWELSCQVCIKERVAEKGIDPLTNLLDNGEREERTAAARALGELKSKEAVPMLVKSLEDKESMVRSEVIEALDNMEETSAMPSIVKCLSDRDSLVRYNAIWFMRKLGDATVIPYLEKLKETEDEDTQNTIDEAIDEIRERLAENREEEMEKQDEKKIEESKLTEPQTEAPSVPPVLDDFSKQLLALIGRNTKSREIQDFLRTLKGKREIDKFDDCYYYTYKEQGIELRFNNDDTLDTFFFFKKDKNHEEYEGKLPIGLSISDTRSDIERKLGKPPDSGGGEVTECWTSYPKLGISVTYADRKFSSESQIHNIGFSKPK